MPSPPRAQHPSLAALLLGCALASPAMAQPAAEPAPPPAPPTSAEGTPQPEAPTTPAPSVEELAAAARTTVRETTVRFARGVDSWFGDRPFEDGGSVSNGQLEIGLLKRESEQLDADLRLNARFRLPNLERLGYLFVGRDNERELITDRPGALTRQDQLRAQTAEDKKFFVGLGRTLDDIFDFRIGLRGAFKFYAQARARAQWQFGDDQLLELRETLFWTADDRAGSTTALSYEHRFSPSLGARWIGAATITQELPKFVWASSTGLYKAYGAQQQLSLELLVNGQQDSGVDALDYGVQARWEQPLLDDWLIGAVTVGHFWPRPAPEVPRTGSYALGLNLKMRF